MKRALRIIALMLLLSPLFPAGPARATDTLVLGVGVQFVPAVAEVPRGSGVVWENREVYRYPVVLGYHNLIGDPTVAGPTGAKPFPITSPILEPGDSWACTGTPEGPSCTGLDGTTTLLPPGRYAYMCGVHPNQMHGLLVVS
jgi:plastocyanin